MKKSYRYRPAEKKVTLRDFTKNRRTENFRTRIQNFTDFLVKSTEQKKCLYMRKIVSPMDREVHVHSSFESGTKKMLMFGSNNYLGLANHPYIQEEILKMMQKYG